MKQVTKEAGIEEIDKKMEECKAITENHLDDWCVAIVLPQLYNRHIPLGETRNHVIYIGAKLLTHSWFGDKMYSPGDFVKAILANNLQESYMRADSANINMIPFYVSLVYNYGRTTS